MEILRTEDFVRTENPNPGDRYRLDLITREQKAEKLSGFLAVLPAGKEVPYHYHERRESLIIVISGEAVEICEGKEHPVKAGDVIYIPSAEKHALINRSTKDVRYLEFFTPVKDDFVVANGKE
jgi:quercetin dioxygenase-like cupin family protein